MPCWVNGRPMRHNLAGNDVLQLLSILISNLIMNNFFQVPFVSLSATLLIAGCATPTIYYQDGKPSYIVSCSGPAWGDCLEKAGANCQKAGYEVREKHSTRDFGAFAGSSVTNEMVITCRPNPIVAETKPEYKNLNQQKGE